MKATISWRKDNGRYYKVSQQYNFLGGISLICSWGSLYSVGRGSKEYIFTSREEMQKKLSYIKTRRKYRGYNVVGLLGFNF